MSVSGEWPFTDQELLSSDVQTPNVVCPFQIWISAGRQGVAQWWGAALGHSNELDPQHYKKKEKQTNQTKNAHGFHGYKK